MGSERQVGDRRCWPCTLANAAAALVVAWFPLAAMLLAGNRAVLPVAAAWGAAITAYAAYRVVGWGHLPLAERVARGTGLHDRIGPEARSGETERGASQETSRQQDDHAERE